MEQWSDNKKSKRWLLRWSNLALLLALLIAVILSRFDEITCSGLHGNIRCLAGNPFSFQLIGFADPVLDVAIEKSAKDPCTDPQFTADTLTVTSKVIPNNAHYTEHAVEMIDSMLLVSPECFLIASEKIKPEARRNVEIVFGVLDYGTDFKSKGRESLRKFSNDGRFLNSLRDFSVSK